MASHHPPTPDLNWHLLFLSRIYSFTGWLGLLGGVFVLASIGAPGQQATPILGMSPALSGFLLICWSILLLNFSKDIYGNQRWSTGIGGCLIGLFQLISVPIGTAIGTYTLWILYRNRRLAG